MLGGSIMTRETILARLCAIDEPTDEILATVNDQRTSDTAQIIIICEDVRLVRFLWFSLRDGGASLRQCDPVFSRALSENWQQHLIEVINTGQREYMQINMSRVQYLLPLSVLRQHL